jgi:hypothetical protein
VYESSTFSWGSYPAGQRGVCCVISPEDAPVIEGTFLTEKELRQAIVNKTVYLNVSGFELPIRYKPNGRMTGNMGVVAATFSQGDGSRDSGRWWIDANQLCQRWTSWMDGQIHCYKISRQGNVIIGFARMAFREQPA